MPVGPGKSRINLTLPEKLLMDLQHEAEHTNRSVSEVVATTIQEAWQSDETKLASLQRQLTQQEAKLELKLATIDQLLERVVQLLEGEDANSSRQHPEKTEPLKVVTAEEMYGPITRTTPEKGRPWNS